MTSLKLTIAEYKGAVEKLSGEHDLSQRERAALVAILMKDVSRRERAAETRRKNLEAVGQSSDGPAANPSSASDEVNADSSGKETDDESDDPKPGQPNNRRPRQFDAHINHALTGFEAGKSCPRCAGKMYKENDRVVVRITCQVPFSREKHHLETGVCKNCGFAKSADPGFDEKSLVSECSPEAAASLIVYHYYLGLAFYRIKTLMQYFSRSLSTSKQWDIMSEASDRLAPLFFALWFYAKEKAVSVRADDSGAKLLKPPDQHHNTTALYFDTGQNIVSIMVTGSQHAGEVTATLAKARSGHEPMVRIGDAAAENFIATDGFVDGCCNEHAFAYFKNTRENHPKNYAFVAGIYNQVFENEAKCKGLGANERLRYHQLHSAPLMGFSLNLV